MSPETQFNLDAGPAMAMILVYVVIMVAALAAYVTIIRKAGWSGWWILIAFVPFVNVVMFFVFAFAEWPVHRDLKATRYALDQSLAAHHGHNRFTWST